MVIGELVGYGIEFPAQQFFFLTGVVRNRWPSGAKCGAGRAEEKRKKKGGRENKRWNWSQELLSMRPECDATYGDV